MKDKLAVVLVSGGMDSAMCIALAVEKGFKVAALHLNYGQRTQERELKAFNDLSDFYGIENRLVVNMDHLVQIGGSSLTDTNMEVSEADTDSNNIPTSYVPFRNANILAVAVSWAEVIQADAIFIGAMQTDSSGYPDCRQEFFEAFQNTINSGTKPETKIQIITPIINFTKPEIVSKGLELKVPFHLTWSCYKESEIACGHCDSCALRLRGFQKAGKEDPIPYKDRPLYK